MGVNRPHGVETFLDADACTLSEGLENFFFDALHQRRNKLALFRRVSNAVM
jgi:hypothetical protein